MRRVLLAIGMTAAVGCDGGSKAPSFARPVDDTPAPGTAPTTAIAAPKPERSEPAAEQTIGELLLKHTASEPSRLERVRTYISRRSGTLSTGAAPQPMTLIVHAVWPDRQRAVFTLDVPGGRVSEAFGARGGSIWNAKFVNPKDAVAAPIDADKYEEARSDLWAEWVAVLHPLAAADRRVAAAPADADGSPVVRLWGGDHAPVLLSIDAKTGLLIRVRYEIRAAGRTVVRTLQLGEHKEVAGVKLPHRLAYSEGPLTGTVYNAVEYELPATIDPGVFEKP